MKEGRYRTQTGTLSATVVCIRCVGWSGAGTVPVDGIEMGSLSMLSVQIVNKRTRSQNDWLRVLLS